MNLSVWSVLTPRWNQWCWNISHWSDQLQDPINNWEPVKGVYSHSSLLIPKNRNQTFGMAHKMVNNNDFTFKQGNINWETQDAPNISQVCHNVGHILDLDFSPAVNSVFTPFLHNLTTPTHLFLLSKPHLSCSCSPQWTKAILHLLPWIHMKSPDKPWIRGKGVKSGVAAEKKQDSRGDTQLTSTGGVSIGFCNALKLRMTLCV